MSSRHLRKLLGDTALPQPTDSDEEFEPLYTKTQTSRFQMDDEDDNENPQPLSDNLSEQGDSQPAPRKKKNKKKKKKNRTKEADAFDAAEPGPSHQQTEELDEIDRSVREVNELLGEVEIRPSTSKQTAAKPVETFMTINPKYLNSAFEMKKMLGTETADNRSKRDGQPGIMFLQRRAVIVPMDDYVNMFKKTGLTMTVLRREGPLTYFAITHDIPFSRAHLALKRVIQYRRALAHDYVAFLKTQVDQDRADPELWLQFADQLFMMEETTLARRFLEQAIAYFQFISHPAFNLADSNVRLEYRFLENQQFFTGCLRLVHLLTNRACHRAALELAKLLLALEPRDPLAMLLLLDALALRAREHRWLLAAESHWTQTRDADKLYNIQYSVPLAMWHVATKDKVDIGPATQRLRLALLQFPRIFTQIAELASLTVPAETAKSRLFTELAAKSTTALTEMGLFYARLTYNRWREPRVAAWLLHTAAKLARDVQTDKALQARAESFAADRVSLYRSVPTELMRHLAVIKPMATLLHDNLVNSVSNVPDELPPDPLEIDRYGYKIFEDKISSTTSTVYEFLRSLVPGGPPEPQAPPAVPEPPPRDHPGGR